MRVRPLHPHCHHGNRGREEGRFPISSALHGSASPHGVSKPPVSPLPLGLRLSLPCPSSPPTWVRAWCRLDGLTEVVVEAVRGKVWCGPWWVASPPCVCGGGGAGLGCGGVTCSCVGPSAGGASPGAGPGSCHCLPWGLGLAPEPPAAPGSASSEMGYRSAPLPGWTGTVGGEAPGFGGENLENRPKKGRTPTPPHPRVQKFSLEGPCAKYVSSGEGPAGPAGMSPLSGVPSAPPGPQAPHRAPAFHPLPLYPLHLPLPGQVLGLHHACKAQVLLRVLVA